MRNTKRRMEVLPFYDRTGMERHFEKMARKGWMIHRFYSLFWTYRRIEPQKLHFCVSYYPKASEFDPEPGEDQLTFRDFCAHSGWELACSWAQMQVFYNTRENPVPIETDPVLEVETIHAAMWRNFLPSQCVLLVMGLVLCWMRWLMVFGNPVAELSNAMGLFSLLSWSLVVLMAAMDIFVHLRWHKRAEMAAEQGIFLTSGSTAKFQWITLCVIGAGALWMAWRLLSGNAMLQFITLCMSLYMVLLLALVEGVKRLGRKWKLSRSWNRGITWVSAFVLAYGMMGAITFCTLNLNNQGFFREEETYEHQGMTWTHYRDEIPLRIEDLMDVQWDYVTRSDADETPLLGMQEIYQRPRFDDPDYRIIPDLEYTIVQVKLPFLYDRCKKEMLEINQASIPYEFRDRYDPVDPAVWGAVEAYRQVNDSEDWESNRYLLCYPDTLVEIHFSWEVTDSQKQITGQILG